MRLLLCPNCQSNMQALNRAGVEFDMCPSCRGVWLDRGELEKIIQGSHEGELDRARPAPAYAQPPHPRDGYGEQGAYGERGEYGRDRGHAQHRRKRRFDLFNIFD